MRLAPGFRHLWDRQGIGLVSRVERGSRGVLGTPMELNLYVASRLVAEPRLSPEALFAHEVEPALRGAGLTEDASDLSMRLRHQTLACEAWLFA